MGLSVKKTIHTCQEIIKILNSNALKIAFLDRFLKIQKIQKKFSKQYLLL